ncbi:hypothetical protein [Chlamydia vaughanii]|uniref:hypothetical protein n=1 Tax=Chlamydia vaughanii TaxID=3112552 RepID=UPI0032B21F28
MSAALSSYQCRLLLIFADIEEAKSLIRDFAFIQKGTNLFQCRDSHTSIAMDMIILNQWGESGVLEAFQTIEEIETYHACVNIGFAGACSKDLLLHNCYTIEHISELSKDSPFNVSDNPELSITPIPSFPTAKLVSAHAPYKHGTHETFQLIDMEGYTIARLCSDYHLRCIMLKIASDFTTTNGGDYLNLHKNTLAEELSSAFASCLHEIVELAVAATVRT